MTLRVGFSLFTMTPRLMTGTANNARAVVGGLADPEHGVDPVLLVNRLMLAHLAPWSAPPLPVVEIRSLTVRDTPLARLAMIGRALVLPSPTRRQVPRNLDVVHYPLTLSFPRTEHPRVVTLHDVQHHDLPEFFTPAQRRWRRYAYDDAARSADVIVTTSEYTKSRIVERLDINPERIEAILLGIDHSLFAPAGTGDERLVVNFRLNERFLLYPAALWPHKNHPTLIDALALMADREIELVFTGPSLGGLDRLMAHAAREGVSSRVRHLGFVSTPQLAALYRRAEVTVFPSLYEGFGMPPLEAMACGCPVAVSAVASLPEACGDAAAWFDPRSPEAIAIAIDGLLADEALRADLTHRGIRHASAFTWRAAAAGHAAVYRRAAMSERRSTVSIR